MTYGLFAHTRARRRSSPPNLGVAAFASTIAIAAATMSGPAFAQPQERAGPAPLLSDESAPVIPGQYIVVFKEGTSPAQLRAAQERVKALGGEILHTYTSALIGFSVRLPREPDRAKAALDFLRSLPEVAFVEADQKVTGHTIQPPTPGGVPPTGLDRIDRRLLGVAPTPALNGTYTYSETGATVHVYVIDSGTRDTHVEFSGRVTGGMDFVGDGAGTDGCHPHGTHVAGTVGSETFGVAKDVALHPVRVLDCTNSGTWANIIAGVNWVAANAVQPAVANMSLGGGVMAAADTAVTNSIAAGITYVISAGNAGVDACNVSPARTANAITGGATVSDTDARAVFGTWQSNIGPCLDLFAPGANILSLWDTNDTATGSMSGTSMAAPHVAGVAARYLQTHPAATPAAVWAAILSAANVVTTAGWGGVVNAGLNSPNVLLHWGSLDDGFTDGDPHIRTTDGVYYDFQSAGEFTLLRDGNGLEIQTRQTPVSTQPPIANPHTGLAACVSLNEAVAARVAGRRVTYQPGDNGMVLRVDGAATPVTAQGVTLGQGARVAATGAGNGIAIDFPDGTNLTATSHFWGAPHNRWYLNVSVLQTPASEGVMGDLAQGSWLPALPSGASLGPKPASAAQRFTDLYQTFADAWRVSDATSLFDYASGQSAATFTLKDWPPQSGSCVIPEAPLAAPKAMGAATQLCRGVRDKNRNANCVFDVAITGHAGFAKAYLLSQRIEAGSTKTDINVDGDRLRYGVPAKFAATVSRRAADGKGSPAGTVRFSIDGEPTGKPARVDATGRAQTTVARLAPGKHRIEARFAPLRSGLYLPSADEAYVFVGDEKPETDKRLLERQ